MVVFRLVFCCNVKPLEGEGQETVRFERGLRVVESSGAPGVWMAVMADQNPPSRVKFSPDRARHLKWLAAGDIPCYKWDAVT